MKNTQMIETFLPIFPGFYDTQISGDLEIDNFLYSEELELDEINFDFKQYQIDCSFYACRFIENELKKFGVISIKFQELISPKFYNYGTDSINCEIEIDPELISGYLLNNADQFKDYIKNNYSSCDGFISHFSNNSNDWALKTDNFTNFIDSGKHFLGSILTFICQNEFISENDLSYYILDNIYVDHYIEILENENN